MAIFATEWEGYIHNAQARHKDVILSSKSSPSYHLPYYLKTVNIILANYERKAIIDQREKDVNARYNNYGSPKLFTTKAFSRIL